MGSAQRKEFDNTNIPKIRNPDWMSSIPDGRYISDLSIPGTHNTLSLYGYNLFQCHSWCLYTQYEAGIRFVDLRCRHFHNSLPIHHDLQFQHYHFKNVLKDTINFLYHHPRETIIMHVKEEYKAANNTESFSDTVAHYIQEVESSWFWKSTAIPTMSQARGKIIILQNFGGPQMGIPYNTFCIADAYHVPTLFAIGWKWSTIEENLNSARYGDCMQMYLTFCSGSSLGAYPNAVADRINYRLYNYLESKAEKVRWGIIALDFPGAELVQLIIKSN
ncbi:uncharacterized protein LOC115474224 [Microcaecilia unicolor]|uniref:Uncharacterized protein LOC115474224 n=1 Tax=Microcaecilia unicolor TaxID=1415580 RepID=A0A6P7YQD0_9AMPH|nr:uncharacterized protein LOC115474224 [Microcaecilia unicolor]XP_030065461.1 uncharacterized protein LOC115474224 [Microcaecilia unicolor]